MSEPNRRGLCSWVMFVLLACAIAAGGCKSRQDKPAQEAAPKPAALAPPPPALGQVVAEMAKHYHQDLRVTEAMADKVRLAFDFKGLPFPEALAKLSQQSMQGIHVRYRTPPWSDKYFELEPDGNQVKEYQKADGILVSLISPVKWFFGQQVLYVGVKTDALDDQMEILGQPSVKFSAGGKPVPFKYIGSMVPDYTYKLAPGDGEAPVDLEVAVPYMPRDVARRGNPADRPGRAVFTFKDVLRPYKPYLGKPPTHPDVQEWENVVVGNAVVGSVLEMLVYHRPALRKIEVIVPDGDVPAALAAHCANLRELRFANIFPNDPTIDLSPLVRLPRLERLDVSGQKIVSIVPAARMASLKTLEMPAGGLPAEDWQAFAAAGPRVEELILQSWGQNMDWQQLARLPMLQALVLEGCKGFDWAVLPRLKGLRSLKVHDIPPDLAVLKQLTWLKTLDLGYFDRTAQREQAIETLRQGLPGCDVQVHWNEDFLFPETPGQK